MKYKPDWPEAKERLTALWEGRPTDRPCIAVTVPRSAPSGAKATDRYDDSAWALKQSSPRTMPADPADFWLDSDWVACQALTTIESTWWGGEAIPSFLLMGGWVVSLGGRPRFDYRTIWFEPFPVEFDQPHPFHHNQADPWVKRYQRLYLRMAREAGRNDFLLGPPGFLPAHDLLSMHMGTENFLLALLDHPAWMRRAIEDGARELLQARRELILRVQEHHDLCYGNAGWMPFWAPEPYIATQSDVSCMLSPELFEEFVVPELDIYGQECGAMWYHLDGHDARQHLPRLLSLPYLRVIQYVPTPAEPPNGEAHLAFYRKVQRAGRIVHIEVAKDQVEPLCRALDPRLLMLDVSWSCRSPEEGQELLAAAKRWTAAGTRPG